MAVQGLAARSARLRALQGERRRRRSESRAACVLLRARIPPTPSCDRATRTSSHCWRACRPNARVETERANVRLVRPQRFPQLRGHFHVLLAPQARPAEHDLLRALLDRHRHFPFHRSARRAHIRPARVFLVDRERLLFVRDLLAFQQQSPQLVRPPLGAPLWWFSSLSSAPTSPVAASGRESSNCQATCSSPFSRNSWFFL